MRPLLLGIFILVVNLLSGQSQAQTPANDSVSIHNVFALGINPSNLFFGEEGLLLKIEPNSERYYLVGLSYNTFIPNADERTLGSYGEGLSVHAGFMFALNNTHLWYLGLQGFYRNWNIHGAIEDIGNGGFLDNYLNGGSFLLYADEQNNLQSYNAILNIANLDIICSKQVLIGKFIFDCFFGAGARVKFISLYYQGWYPSYRYPNDFVSVPGAKSMQTQYIPDIKAGVVIEYRL